MPNHSQTAPQRQPDRRIDRHDVDLNDAVFNYTQLNANYSLARCIDIAPQLLEYVRKNPQKIAFIDPKLTPGDLEVRLKSMIVQCAGQLYGALNKGSTEGYLSAALMVDEIRMLLFQAGEPLSVLDKSGKTDNAAMDAKLMALETPKAVEEPTAEEKPSNVITIPAHIRMQAEMREETQKLYTQIVARDMTGYPSFASMVTRFRETVKEQGWKLNHFDEKKSAQSVNADLIRLANVKLTGAAR